MKGAIWVPRDPAWYRTLVDRATQGGLQTRGSAFLLWPALLERFDEAPSGHLYCLAAMPVRLFAHQQAAVQRAVGPLQGRAILADEVGLGKTVEAGAILKELMLRGRVRRALVLAPAALVRQWHAELLRHCAIRACIHPRPDHGWDRPEVVLASLQTARRSPHAEAIAGLPWDIVIVDEAHRLHRASSAAFRLVAAVRKRALLLITATPVQNDLHELYHLVSLLRPGQLGTPRTFRREFTRDRRTPRNTVHLRRLVGEVLIRTRRPEAGLTLPPRQVSSVLTLFGEPHRRLYEELLRTLRAMARQMGGQERARMALVASLLLREATSSPVSLSHTLTRLVARPPDEKWRPWLEALARLARRSRHLARHDPGPKIGWVVEWLRREPPQPGSVVLFTQFVSTAKAAAEALARAGMEPALYCGEMDLPRRRAALESFRERLGVLVSTDAGSEGQNLQWAWRLVNLDLPWNPMRVEQRIGRLHRLGQSRPVEVVNLAVPGTIEEYVLTLLYEKLGMFREVVGDLDEVVATVPGGLGAYIGRLVLSGADDEAVLAGLRHLGGFLERQWRRWKRARELTATLLDGPKQPPEEGQDEGWTAWPAAGHASG